MTRYRISFHVVVDVDAHDPTDAIHTADQACGWPGDYSPPAAPVVKTKVALRGSRKIEATVIRSQALMIKEAP